MGVLIRAVGMRLVENLITFSVCSCYMYDMPYERRLLQMRRIMLIKARTPCQKRHCVDDNDWSASSSP